MILIFNDKAKAQYYSELVHNWLIKNRKDYRAEIWSDIDASVSDKGDEYYVKVPPDYEVLNAKIAKPEEKLTISADATKTTEKLPDNWRTKI